MELDFIDLIEDCNVGERIDKYLVEELNDYSRSFIQKLIQDKHILVNGEATKSNYKLRKKDQIEVKVPKEKELIITPQEIAIDCLYQDEDLMIVNKEQGMVVHPAKGHSEGTLVNALLYAAKDNLSTIKGDLRPGIVHRIDKDTSGILIVAKNDKAHKKLASMLKEHQIIRKYHALVFGNFKEKEGRIDAPIGRHPVNRKKRVVTDKNARNALTFYKVIEQFNGFAHVEVTLSTGRTHQIRVHMNHIGHPVLGDPLYGPKKQPYGLKGQALHAKILAFEHPTRDEHMLFDSPLPLYFTQLIDKLLKK